MARPEPGVPAAARIRQHHHQHPRCIHPGQAQWPAGRLGDGELVDRRRLEHPVHAAERHPAAHQCEQMDEQHVQHKVEQRHSAEDEHGLQYGGTWTSLVEVEQAQGEQRGPEGHQQEQQRRRILVGVQERQHGAQRVRLRSPRLRIAVEVDCAEQHERDDKRPAEPQQEGAPTRLWPVDDAPEREADRCDTDPRDERIRHEDEHPRRRQQDSGLVQKKPDRGEGAERRRRHAIGEVVQRDEPHTERSDRAEWQTAQRGERHHRPAECPEHVEDGHAVVDVELPDRPHERLLEHDEPESARQQEARQLGARPMAQRERGAGAREQEEDGGAEVGDPASEEEHRARGREVGRARGGVAQVVAGVVERHEDHHGTTQQVDRVDAATGRATRRADGSSARDAVQREGIGGDRRHGRDSGRIAPSAPRSMMPAVAPAMRAAPVAQARRAERRILKGMDTPLPRWPIRTLLLAWSIPAVLGVPFAIGSLRTATSGPAPWRVLVVVAVTWQIWTLLTVPVIALADRFPLERPWRVRAVMAHVAASLATCAAQALATAIVFRWLVDPDSSTLAWLTGYMFMRFAPSGVILYTAIVAIRTSQVQRARTQALATGLAEARLQSLRAQLRPHFLFNALNATVALMRDGENARAADALLGIADLLRATLRGDARHEVTLEEELGFVEQYLSIERLRMGDRLRVQVDVPPSLLDARVPSLCLQPFVENAVRHGLRHVPGEAVVSVSATASDGRLRLHVTDNGVGLPSVREVETTSGIGIGNARARLALLHGEAASVRVGAGTGGRGTTAELIVPLARG